MEASLNISGEDVIEKLKDEGDFDKLRLKIIRKLKDNEELRSNIIAIVKQSAALNRAGTENVKPRQISDAIYEEVGDEIMGKVSDELWKIIKSADGMKDEITATVESVYNRLANPGVNEDAAASTHHAVPVRKEAGNEDSLKDSASGVELHETDPLEPPGFSFANNQPNDEKQLAEEAQLPKPYDGRRNEEAYHQNNVHDRDNVDLMPGVSSNREHNQMYTGASSDEDPDVPPGFG